MAELDADHDGPCRRPDRDVRAVSGVRLPQYEEEDDSDCDDDWDMRPAGINLVDPRLEFLRDDEEERRLADTGRWQRG